MKIASEALLASNTPQSPGTSGIEGTGKPGLFKAISQLFGLGVSKEQGGDRVGLPVSEASLADAEAAAFGLSPDVAERSGVQSRPSSEKGMSDELDWSFYSGILETRTIGLVQSEMVEDFVGPPAPVSIRATTSVASENGEMVEDFVGPPAPVAIRATTSVVSEHAEVVRDAQVMKGRELRSVVNDAQLKAGVISKNETQPASVSVLGHLQSNTGVGNHGGQWQEIPGPGVIKPDLPPAPTFPKLREALIGASHKNRLAGAPEAIETKTRAVQSPTLESDELFWLRDAPPRPKTFVAGQPGVSEQKLSTHLNPETQKISSSSIQFNLANSGSIPGSDVSKSDPIPTTEQTWGQRIVQQLHFNIVHGRTNNINLQLHPASLGALNIHLKKVGEKIEISITTQTRSAHKLISDSGSKLAMLLADSGVKLEAFKILNGEPANLLQDSSNGDRGNHNQKSSGDLSSGDHFGDEEQKTINQEIFYKDTNKIIIYA
jgi:hypothetical protein